MKRKLLLATTALVLLVMCLSLVCIRRGEAKRVKLNVKDLPEHGVTIVGPTTPSFDSELLKLKEGKDQKQLNRINALAPFSGFIKNSGKGDLVAYTVRWDISADNKVNTSYSSYNAPGILMGEKMAPADTGDTFNGKRIRKGSTRIISLDQSIDGEGGPHFFASATTDADTGQLQQALQSGDDEAITRALSEQLARADNITISLDSAVFDDGTVIGPDNAGSFDTLQAAIAAKKDLLASIMRGLKGRKAPAEILNHIDDVRAQLEANQTTQTTRGTPKYYYRYFSMMYRTEISKMRNSLGDDKRTLNYVLEPTIRPWPKLRKASQQP